MNKIINAYDIMKSIIFYMVKKLEIANSLVLFMELHKKYVYCMLLCILHVMIL